MSDNEWVELLFAVMLPNLVDLREQFPLSVEGGVHELTQYRVDAPLGTFPGTRELAERLKIKHPKVTGNGESDDWVPTTDLILTLRSSVGALELLAISLKPEGALTKRKIKLLELEKAYWDARDIDWLLITPKQFDERVGLTLRCSMPWALGEKTLDSDKEIAATLASDVYGCSLTFLLKRLSNYFGDMEHAQRAFWQGVWCGKIPMDLRRDWRPHHPIALLSSEDFWSLNPIASRRSAWN